MSYPARYVLRDVYVAPRGDGKPWQDSAIAPDTRMANGAVLLAGPVKRAGWAHLVTPEQTVVGFVSEGSPPGGDYCPQERLVDAEGRVSYRP